MGSRNPGVADTVAISTVRAFPGCTRMPRLTKSRIPYMRCCCAPVTPDQAVMD